MTSVNPAYPGGAYPPPPPAYSQTQYGQPMGTQYGQPMGTQYGQPAGPPANAVVVVQQPHHINNRYGGQICPHCQVGVVTQDITILGLILCILFFPLGMICCLMMTEKRCSHCKVQL